MRNTLTNILTFPSAIESLRATGYTRPLFVDLHTSNVCNQKCDGCPYTSHHSHEYMSEKDHFEAVDKFIDFGVKAFDFAGGGEPTTLPYLPRLMRYIKERGCYFGLITNGVLMSDDLKETLVLDATYVRVSLEASDEETYERYKKHKGWKRVSENLDSLVAAKIAYKSTLQIGAKFAVGKSMHGLRHYLNGLGYGIEHCVDRITFKALTGEPEELSQEDLRNEARLLQKILGEDAGLRAKTSYWLEQYDDADIAQCWLNQMHTVMDYKGNLYICCYYYVHGETHRIGNIFESRLEDIWLDDLHKQKVKNIDREICKSVYCKFFHHHLALRESEKRGRAYFL